ncbi:hypothetical protein CO615_10560 [Lysobacteraceae bacterium NML75-0749]|nr:hypothetical protein CO615_10560 [Xanthomonadaceae bacterium NML75-0749]
MNIETLKAQVKNGVEFAIESEFSKIYRITNASGEYVLFAYVDQWPGEDELIALFPQWHGYKEGYEFDRGGSSYGLGAKRIQPGSDVAAEIADLVANSAALARQFLTGDWTTGLPDYYIFAEDEERETLAKAAMIADGMDIWG